MVVGALSVMLFLLKNKAKTYSIKTVEVFTPSEEE